MAFHEFHYRWELDLKSRPHDLWPYVADTNRFNRDTGLPDVVEAAPVQKNARRLLRFHIPLLDLKWEEDPFEWSYPYRFGVVRRYQNGPLRQMRILLQMETQPDGRTRLVYQVWAAPRNLLGVIGIPLAIGQVSARRFQVAFRQYDGLAQAGAVPITLSRASHLMPGARQRLDIIRQRLVRAGSDATLVERLVELVEHADDLTLVRIRPYLLADLWGASRRDVLEMALLATRVGLLDFQWEILCPMCRGAEDRVYQHLDGLHSEAHCDSCNIDFKVNFDHSVELTFRPNPAIRAVTKSDFCVAGPRTTPHVVVQQLIPAGEQRQAMPVLETGRYRLRTMTLPGGQHLQVTAVGQSQAQLQATKDGWPAQELALSPTPTLHLSNETEDEQLLILERLAWSDQAATAAEVTTLQRFRDLFANEALRPGEQISVGSLTVLFTDLCDSTQMYREIGDASAFGVVMNHFDVLREAIDVEGGALVKTIGDAVMAVFQRPVAGLRAILRANEVLATPPPGRRPLRLRAALHLGPSIAVSLNERLDYFGSTINAAARLEKFSQGGDVVLSQTVYEDPEVAEFLSDPSNPFRTFPNS
ncbi:MAG: adenylate/guanylate cyclase domain-containing protein [Ardenticatenaceae bacterium]|nr:adenylate/guanylate cyclase domain-containing protein [Ardenticatenaceae bacterium]MCB9443833.1 adenylate/guanylate cyclase domain-containing protein [Ardenticatenaceae bacterium]